MYEAIDQPCHVRLFYNIIFGLALFMVLARCATDRRIVGQVGHQVLDANGVRLEAGRTVCITSVGDDVDIITHVIEVSNCGHWLCPRRH
jgi:hypothetical protein